MVQRASGTPGVAWERRKRILAARAVSSVRGRDKHKGKTMNKKFIIAWIVVFVAWFMGSFVIHGVLLRADYMQLTNLFRNDGDQQRLFPLM
jgi:hypothetical protein